MSFNGTLAQGVKYMNSHKVAWPRVTKDIVYQNHFFQFLRKAGIDFPDRQTMVRSCAWCVCRDSEATLLLAFRQGCLEEATFRDDDVRQKFEYMTMHHHGIPVVIRMCQPVNASQALLRLNDGVSGIYGSESDYESLMMSDAIQISEGDDDVDLSAVHSY